MLAAKLKQFLVKHEVSFQKLNHEASSGGLLQVASDLKINPKAILKSILVGDEHSPLLVVLPLNVALDINKLESALGRTFQLMTSEEVNKLFYDCEPDCHPPLGEPYGIPVILAQEIGALTDVYFDSGCASVIIHMSFDEFYFLSNGAAFLDLRLDNPQTLNQSFSLDIPPKINNKLLNKTPMEIDKFGYCHFPPLPSIAKHILSLKNESDGIAIQKLSDIFESDLFLRTQILQLVKTQEAPLYSLQEIIENDLGLNTALSLGFGLSAGRVFQLPKDASLDFFSFWQHAQYAAELLRSLAKVVPKNKNIDIDLVYLLGLIHNFGFLLFGHLFGPEFRLLVKWMETNPKVPIEVLEKRLLGMGHAKQFISFGHAQLGAWLMEFWEMPEPIPSIVGLHHHGVDESLPYQAYISIIQLTNSLLRTHCGLGDGFYGKIDENILDSLSLPKKLVEEIMDNFLVGKTAAVPC